MLMGSNRTLAAELLEQMGLASAVLGDDQLAAGSPGHLASLPAEMDREAYPAVLASWTIDRGAGHIAKLVERWRERLMLSNDDRDGLQSVLDLHASVLASWTSLTVAGQKRMAVLPWFNTAVDLTAVDAPEHAEAVRARVAELAAQGDMSPSPWLTGATLIEAGFAPGPDFTRVIDAVYDAQLESRIASPDEALALARHLFEN